MHSYVLVKIKGETFFSIRSITWGTDALEFEIALCKELKHAAQNTTRMYKMTEYGVFSSMFYDTRNPERESLCFALGRVCRLSGGGDC